MTFFIIFDHHVFIQQTFSFFSSSIGTANNLTKTISADLTSDGFSGIWLAIFAPVAASFSAFPSSFIEGSSLSSSRNDSIKNDQDINKDSLYSTDMDSFSDKFQFTFICLNRSGALTSTMLNQCRITALGKGPIIPLNVLFLNQNPYGMNLLQSYESTNKNRKKCEYFNTSYIAGKFTNSGAERPFKVDIINLTHYKSHLSGSSHYSLEEEVGVREVVALNNSPLDSTVNRTDTVDEVNVTSNTVFVRLISGVSEAVTGGFAVVPNKSFDMIYNWDSINTAKEAIINIDQKQQYDTDIIKNFESTIISQNNESINETIQIGEVEQTKPATSKLTHQSIDSNTSLHSLIPFSPGSAAGLYQVQLSEITVGLGCLFLVTGVDIPLDGVGGARCKKAHGNGGAAIDQLSNKVTTNSSEAFTKTNRCQNRYRHAVSITNLGSMNPVGGLSTNSYTNQNRYLSGQDDENNRLRSPPIRSIMNPLTGTHGILNFEEVIPSNIRLDRGHSLNKEYTHKYDIIRCIAVPLSYLLNSNDFSNQQSVQQNKMDEILFNNKLLNKNEVLLLVLRKSELYGLELIVFTKNKSIYSETMCDKTINKVTKDIELQQFDDGANNNEDMLADFAAEVSSGKWNSSGISSKEILNTSDSYTTFSQSPTISVNTSTNGPPLLSPRKSQEYMVEVVPDMKYGMGLRLDVKNSAIVGRWCRGVDNCICQIIYRYPDSHSSPILITIRVFYYDVF